MNDTTALAEIQRLARSIGSSSPGTPRSGWDQRGAKRSEVRAALVSATSALAQDRGGWRVEGGCDREGDDLTVVVDIEADVIVITLF